MSKKYIVTEDILLELLKDCVTLEALERGGVDNWQWHGDSINDYLEEEHCKDLEEAAQMILDIYIYEDKMKEIK